MMDIFDAKILCKECNTEMKHSVVDKNGFQLRAMQCSKCGDQIIHPVDLERFNHFRDLKGKTFSVKLRVVGNSHAISIPKEIVEFIQEHQRQMRRDMDDVVRLCFDDFRKLSVRFDHES